MSIAFGEKNESRVLVAGGQNEYTLNAIAFCGAGEDEADVLAAACADTTDFPISRTITLPSGSTVTFVRETVRITPMDSGSDAPVRFDVSVPYVMVGQSTQPYATGDSSFSFAIGSQAVNVKTSKSTVASYSTLAGGAPNHQGCINVTPEGEVQGVDLDFPTYQFSETHYLDDADVGDTYKAALYAVASNPVNNASFKGFAAGEVRFLGVEGAKRHKDGDWELTFKFAASPNFTGLTVGTITGIAKKGWEYLWVYYEEKVDTLGSNKARAVKVRDVYVEQVYTPSDFSTLGIGTT